MSIQLFCIVQILENGNLYSQMLWIRWCKACRCSSSSNCSTNRLVLMAPVRCLPRLHITCRLCRPGGLLILQHCSSSNSSITSSNKPNSRLNYPSLDPDSHLTNLVRCLFPLAGTSCHLGCFSLQLPKEALSGENHHPNHKWFSAHPHSRPSRPPATHHRLTHLVASRLGRYSILWVRASYRNNSRQ